MLNKKLEIDGKKILIIGNWSYKNLGDELILLGNIKLLQKQNKEIFIQAHNCKWLKKFLKGFVDVSEITFLTEIPKGIRTTIKYILYGKWKELGKYRKIDSVIIGGGEILTEESPNSYWYWLVSLFPLILKILTKKTNIYLMGGIQVPQKKTNMFLFKKLLKQTKHIYARDFESISSLKQIGYNNVDFFMDTAYFAWEWQPNKQKNNNNKYIVINLNKYGESFLCKIKEDIKEYHRKGFHLYYVAISKGHTQVYDDKKYYKTLNRKINIELLDWENDFKSFLKILSGAEIVISTRLHLFLMANFLGVKTKVYPYQNKILKMKKVLESLSI